MFEVIGYSYTGSYAEMIKASSKEKALKLGKVMMKKWLPKGVKIIKWTVRNY